MKTPEPPEDERLRLATLRSLLILDTERESRFDRLTRMAQSLFKVPIALISLVDEDRQWIKSSAGLEITETPRSISFCGHAILASEILIVENTLEDERFVDNPLVVGPPDIRFYAGCPLVIDNRKLGTLCIIDHAPRSLGSDEIENLRLLASLVERELEICFLTTKDELTGLDNRRGFVALAQQSLQLCTRQGLPVSLLYLDLDHFNLFNDTHGHEEGDRALAAFADRIKHICRDSDIVARLGSDKFAILLINSTREQSESVIQRIKDVLKHDDTLSGHVQDLDFRYGITAFQPERHETIAELLADADALMAELKQLRTLHLASPSPAIGPVKKEEAEEVTWTSVVHGFREAAG